MSKPRSSASSVKFPRGLTWTPKGWRVTVKRKGQPTYRKRFPPSVPLDDVRKHLETARTRLHAGKSSAPSGTLSADVKRYLSDYFTGRLGYEERARHLALWIAALGADTWRATITRDDVARTLNGWKAAGLAADTCNKRRTALLSLFHALDGKGSSNPVRDIPKFRPPDPEARGVPYRQIAKALNKLRKCKTRARLKVMAYTGARPMQIRRLQPEDWDVKGKTLLIRGTAKGHGTKPFRVPLSTDAQAALKEFDAVDAWGTFASAPMARMWKTVADKAKLPGVVPYDLRHSFGTEIYRTTGDLRVTKELLGHSSLTMTERYTLAAVPERQQLAVRGFNAQRKSPPKSPLRQKQAKSA